MGFHRPVFSRIRTKSAILSLYGRIQVNENPYYRIFSAVNLDTNTIQILFIQTQYKSDFCKVLFASKRKGIHKRSSIHQ